MFRQLTSEMLVSSKRISERELSSLNSHEYTICLLGDWAHVNTTLPTPDNAIFPPAIHEVAAEFDASIVQVSSGSGWSCLLCEDGRAYSFGDNTYGQLGQGHDRPHVAAPAPMCTPFSLLPRRRIIRLSCGSVHGGFVLDVGELYMFGCGSYGRLGTGNEDNTSVPILVRMKWSTLQSTTSGTINHKKQQNVAKDDDDDEVKFTDVSCGDRHTLVLAVRIIRRSSDIRDTTTKSKTSIISFGDGMNGRLGLGDEKDRHEGALLTTWLAASTQPGFGIAGNSGCMAPPTITAICAGTTHNLALSASGDVFSWGNGIDGQLGHGTAASEWVPRQLTFFKDLSISDVSCGKRHSMAVSRTGVVYTWGRGTEGQLGLDLETDSAIDVVDQSVLVPHPVRFLKGSSHRVNIRTISAKHNTSIVLDDRDRMFVWGENTFEQLGLPRSANTEVGAKSYLSKPNLLAYMNLHAPKSAACNSPTLLSHVSSLREMVTVAKPDPIRLGLVHMDAGDRFTMLIFTTKPGISTSHSIKGGEVREINSRTVTEATLTPKSTSVAAINWKFSLTDDLPIILSAIPTRESAYYQFMTNYKVYIRPTISKPREIDDASDDEMDRDMQRRSPHRRDRRGSIIGKRGSLLPMTDTATSEPGWNSTRDERNNVTTLPVHVQGFDAWLNKHRKSPSKAKMTGRSSAYSSHMPVPSLNLKEEEARSSNSTSKFNDTTQTKGSHYFPVKPTKPARILSARRPITSVSDISGRKDASTSPALLKKKISNQYVSEANQEHPERHSLQLIDGIVLQ